MCLLFVRGTRYTCRVNKRHALGTPPRYLFHHYYGTVRPSGSQYSWRLRAYPPPTNKVASFRLAGSPRQEAKKGRWPLAVGRVPMSMSMSNRPRKGGWGSFVSALRFAPWLARPPPPSLAIRGSVASSFRQHRRLLNQTTPGRECGLISKTWRDPPFDYGSGYQLAGDPSRTPNNVKHTHTIVQWGEPGCQNRDLNLLSGSVSCARRNSNLKR